MSATVHASVLLLIYVHNQWSRSLISYLVDFSPGASEAPGAPRALMNADVGFGALAYSAIVSLAFVAVFAPLSLFAGCVADVTDRAALSAYALAAWSLATAWQGAARQLWELVACRMLLGAAQAFTTPAAYTLLADLTHPARRGCVNAVYASGVYLGAGVSALSILAARSLGWRATTEAVAIGGLALAALAALALRDPRAPGPLAGRVPLARFRATAAAIRGHRPVQLLLAASLLRFSAGLAVGTWVAPWARLRFPGREAEFAVVKSFISGVGGTASAVVGGLVSDRLCEAGELCRLWVPAVGLALASLFWWLTLCAESFEAAMGLLLVQFLSAECWFGPTVAVIQSQLPAEVHGGAQGVFSVLMVGGNLAPLLIGVAQANGPLVAVLAAVPAALYAASAVAFALAMALCPHAAALEGDGGGPGLAADAEAGACAPRARARRSSFQRLQESLLQEAN